MNGASMLGVLETSGDRAPTRRSRATDSDPDKDEGVEAVERGGAG